MKVKEGNKKKGQLRAKKGGNGRVYREKRGIKRRNVKTVYLHLNIVTNKPFFSFTGKLEHEAAPRKEGTGDRCGAGVERERGSTGLLSVRCVPNPHN